MILYYIILTFLVGVTIFSYIRWKVEIYQFFFILFYGLCLILFNFGTKIYYRTRKVSVPEFKIPRNVLPSSVGEYVPHFNLRPFEVILGFQGKRPVKVLINKAHTLIGATSGGGKSVSIHSILVQLFSNPAFRGHVYLFDMKSHPKDKLDLWESLVEAYVQRDYDGGVTAAIATLGYVEQTLRVAQDVPTIVIIDEVYPLTQNKMGDTILGTIASQLRLNGALIVTVQHAHHNILKTFTKHNIERRLCGVVMNESQAQTILEVKPSGVKLPVKPGEFLLREPGRAGLIQMVSQEVDYDEVEAIVANILERRIEDDWRLKLYRDVTEGKKPGEKVVGVRVIKNTYGLPNAQEKIMIAYRNFANAGVFEEPKKGQSYTVLLPYPKGVQTILSMDWKENPDAIVVGETNATL